MDGADCRVRGALKGSLASAGGWGSATTRGHFKTATQIKHDGPFSKIYSDKTLHCKIEKLKVELCDLFEMFCNEFQGG